MSYHLNSVGQTVYPNNGPQIPNNQPGAQIVGQKISTAQNQLTANAAYGNQLLASQNGQILSSKGTLNTVNFNNGNQATQHRINQVNGQFVAQNLSGIAGTNIGINDTDLSPALIGDGNFQKQLLNSRQNQIVMSNGQSNGYHIATENQIQQYQQLEQKLLQKHHEKQQKGHERRSQKNIQLMSDSITSGGVIEGPSGRRGHLAQQNKDNIGTNYQLPGIERTIVAADPNASALTANSTSMLFQTPQVRPGSRKMNFNQMSQPKQEPNAQAQYNQLQHLQQMTEYHQNKKQRHERPHNQKGSYVQKGQSCHPQQSIQTGTLSSKNITFNQIQQKHEQPRVQNQNYRGGAFSSQNRATINTIEADQTLTPLLKKHGLSSLNQPSEQQNSGQINLQQQILDNYNNQLNDNLSVYNSNPQQQYAPSGQSQQEQRNKDSRNSKRSVVFSKKPTQEQQKTQSQKPNTPKMNGNTHISKSNQRINNTDQIAQSQQFANGQTQQALTSTGTTKIRVNAPNTVKINKSTIKNLVMQKQQQQLADMQIHLSNDDQIVFQQQNQSKALINQKRRSNAVDQHNRIDSGMMIGAKSITSQSTMKNHAGRMAKKVTQSNLNVNSQPSDQQIYQQQHNMLFNKTMGQQIGQMLIQTPVAVNPNANSGGVNPQNVQAANVQFKKAHSIVTPVLSTTDNKPLNQANNLLVVKLNSSQVPGIKLGQQSDTSPTRGVSHQMNNPMTQFQVQNLASLSPEQQQQFLQQQQLLLHQQSILQQQQQESVAAQIQLVQPSNLVLQTDSQQQSSSRSKIEMNQGHLRPQSQNNRIVQGLNQSNNFQNQMNMSQHSGSNEGGFTKNSGSGQMVQKQLNLKNLSQNGDFLSQQNLGSQQRYLVLQNQVHPPNSTQNQNTQNATVNLQNQSPNNQNKVLSSKHLQIQQIRMVNNSSVDNYNANNSDNGSQRQIQTTALVQTGTLQPQLQTSGGSPGNSKYFLKNQLNKIEPDDGHDSEQRRGMQPGGGMTLEDDVESMLSDQFNTSNESMFRVRGVVPGTTVGFGAGGGGDSTFRCNDSMYDEDRGLISESEDGWYPDKDNAQKNEDRFDDISEHTSDECTDSDQDPLAEGQEKKPKVKKTKGEKGERKKKKRKKLEAEQQEQAKKELHEKEPTTATEAKKMVMTYKKLEGDTKEEKITTKKTQKEDIKPPKKQEDNTKNVKGKDTKNTKAQQIKINIQTKKNDKVQDLKSTKNNFSSPEPRGKNQAKNDQSNKQNTNQQANNKPGKKEDKKEEQKVDDKNKENATVAHTPLKKAKKNGLKLQALNHALPKNLQECHERFFESGFKINPQFEYENAEYARKFLEQFDEPDGEFLDIAMEILDSFLQEYGSESNYLDAEGKKLDQDETHMAITKYLENLGVQEWISINFQKNQVAPTSVTHDPKTGKCKMNIKLPCEYREGRMMGVLDHEIGTHFLRKHNEKLQQWYKKRDKFEMRTCIATEEGLACTNQMVQTVKDGKCKPFLYRSALNYYAAYMAKEMSFVDLFRDLEKYVDNPQARWKFVLRVKRGLTDTSQKGGLFKDQVYLEGAVKVLSRRKSLNFLALLCGKISLFDLDREAIYSILNYEGQLLPDFMADMDDYMHCLDVIAETNHIVDEEWNPKARPLSIEQINDDIEEQEKQSNSSPMNLNQETVDQQEAPDEIHQNGEPAAQPIQEDQSPVENATITADPMPEIPLFQEQQVEERQQSMNIDQIILSDVQTTDPPQIKVEEIDNNPTSLQQVDTTGTS